MTRDITALSEIIDRFDAVLVDQFGVLHDGRAAFPGTIACMQALADRGMPVVALSNSGKRAVPNVARLARLGFGRGLFRAVVTSGELAHGLVGAMLSDGRLSPGDPVLILARDADRSLIEGLAVTPAMAEAEARLVVIAGAEPEHHTRVAYRNRLSPLARRGIPALCANPDQSIYIEGGSAFGPGAVADDYRAAGGPVTMLGKPGAAMFAAGLAALGNPDPARCLMIGDSPAHDIAGAKAAGCAALLVTSGVQGSVGAAVEADYRIDHLRI